MALTKISTAGVKDNAVTSGKIPDLAIGTSEIAIGAVASNRLAVQDGNVDFNDSGKIRLGTGNDLEIYHEGSNSYISHTNNANDLRIRGTYVKLQGANGDNMLLANQDAAVLLYYDNSKKFETTSAGAEVTGDLTITSAAPALVFTETNGDPDFKIQCNGGAFNITDTTNSETRLKINANGKVGIGTTSPQRTLHLSSNNTVFALTDTVASTDEKTKYILSDAGMLGFGKLNDAYDTAVEQLRITNDGKVRVPDNGKFTAGASDDLQIYHLSSDNNSYIVEGGSGSLMIQGDIINLGNVGTTEYYVRCFENGAVYLRYDNSTKLETISTGIKVSGGDAGGSLIIGDMYWDNGSNAGRDMFWDQSADSLVFKDSVNASFGNDNDLQLYHDGGGSKIVNSTGDLQINNSSGDTWIASNGVVRISNNSHNGYMAKFDEDGAVELYYDGTKKFETTSAGAHVWGNLDFMDNAKIRLGTGTDLEIYHNGTDSKIRSDGHPLKLESDAITLKAYGNNDVALTTAINGAVELYYDNSKKLETTANGVEVTGHISGAHGVMEQFFTVCDGSTIALASGNKTVENVTADMDLTSTFADIPGSTFTYTPPTGAKQVIFEFHYYGTFKDPNVIWHHKLFLDSDEVTMARGSFRANEAFTDRIVMKWAFNIGGTAATASGRVASWTGNKTIKMQAREFGSSSEAYLHRLANWDGSTTDVEAPDAAMPCIGITAIG